jgi:hypothetical protein
MHMVESTDHFAPEYAVLALPAGALAVFVDGVLCEDVAPVEVVRAGWPEFSQARLLCNLATQQDDDTMLPEEVERRFPMGGEVTLRQLFHRPGPQPVPGDLPLFVGRIEGIETAIDGGDETVELIARDCSAELERVTVYGRHAADTDGAAALLPGLDTTFNPGGQGNATAEQVMVNGQRCMAFCSRPAEGKAWTCAEAIDYLLGAYLPAGRLQRPDVVQLHGLTQGRVVRDLDVTGLNLLEALQRCCETAGLQFRFVSRLVETGPSEAIVFYRNGRGRAVELNCQPVGERLSVSRTNIGSLHSRRNFYPLTHRYIGQGDFRMYEATFELVKAWDVALESTDYNQFCASTNAEFHKVRDVYRKWCLNEAGNYSDPPYNQGPPYDLSRVFEGSRYLCRRRRFWPTLSTDRQDTTLGYFLEVSFDGGDHWWQYFHAFNNLLDECGIWLSSDQLDVDTWVAALKGLLRFRITASVMSDTRLACTIADGPVASTSPVVDHVITLPRRFQYRKVSGHSVLAGAGDGLGQANEIDDSAALRQFVRQQAMTSAATIETIDAQTPTLALHFEPGDRVTSGTDSRDLLGCRRDSRSLFWIDRVCMDFGSQCTRLKIVRRRSGDL